MSELRAAAELARFAKTAPGRLPSTVQDAIATIEAALAAEQPQPISGWRLVPVEPTEDMMFAAEMSAPRHYRDLYRTMIDAAPSLTPAATVQGESNSHQTAAAAPIDVTDAMVEAACKAFSEETFGYSAESRREYMIRSMVIASAIRAALAARSGR